MKETNDNKIICSLCKKPVPQVVKYKIGDYQFHSTCYQVALERLKPFLQVIFYSEYDYEEWLKDKVI